LADLGSGIIVGGLQKLYSCLTGSGASFDQIREIQSKVRLIIVDEAHRALAPTYRAVIDSLLLGPGNSRLVGLTATPGRSANADAQENRELVELFGGANNRITLQDESGRNMQNPIGYLQENGFLAKVRRVSLRTHIDISPSPEELDFFRQTGDIPDSILKRLGSDATRNKIVLEEIKRLVSSGKKVMVFACSVDQAQLLTMALLASGVEARCIDAKTPKIDREQTIESFRMRDSGCRVLLNYEVLSTGFDAPSTDCVMIVRPTASIVL
jgi:superfamily II DNA or RNA helicase